MEVTKNNFDDLLPEIIEAIDQCSFLAIDCELSGLSVTDEKDNCFETVEERYKVVRKSATQFLVVQFGLCPFFYNPEKDEFTHKAYNFYTFPRNSGHNTPNIRFLCESSSLDFLASCGFDFNKLIYEGIPYLTFTNEEKMRTGFEKRIAFLNEENSVQLTVPENLSPFMEETEERVKRLKLSHLTEITLNNLSNYQRKLIFHNIKPKYANSLYFETVVVSEEEGDDKEGERSESPVLKSDDEQPEVKDDKSETVVKKEKKSNKTKPARRTKSRVLRVAKLSTEEQEVREAEKKKIEMDNITKNVGFSKVIRKISQSNKLVVGHNMLLDVSHTVNQFVDELPPTLAEFKVLVQATFPNLIDTKLMASSHPFREHISSTVLYDLVKRVQSDPFTLPEAKKLLTNNSVGYDLNDRKRHEAGFDAYVTGLCFLGMSQYLGVLHNPKKRRVLPDSPVVMPFLNKLFLMRMLDITYLNISGTDLTPSRSHVFHVTCPDTATGKNIQNWFSQFGPVQIWWRSETSLFVSLNDKEQSAFVIANIDSRPGYKVIPFEQYQKQQAEKKRPLLSRSPDREEKDAAPASPKTFPGSGEQQKKRPKTENKGSTQVKQLFHEPTWN